MRKIPAFFQEKCIFFGLGLVWLSIVGLLFAATVYKHPLQIYNIAMLIALAKAYLHSMNVMHRDLTSKNCLVETDEVN